MRLPAGNQRKERPLLAAALMAAGLLLTLAPPASADLSLISARPLDAEEGEEVENQVIAQFDDAGACAAGNYSATVNWGDGTSSAGTIQVRQPVDGRCLYAVRGSHTYTRSGAFVLSATVTVPGTGESAASTAAAATVTEAELDGEVQSRSAVAGVAFQAEIAELNDDNRLSQPGDFAATINWGDGTSSAGTITGDEGRYGIEGAHTYATAGSFRVIVSVQNGGRTVVLDPGTITVAPGTLPALLPPAASFRILGAPFTLAEVRRRGLRLRLNRGASRARRATLVLRRGRRVLQRSRLRLRGTGSTVTVRWRPSRRVARRLRAGRTYNVRIRITGLPTLQRTFRLRR